VSGGGTLAGGQVSLVLRNNNSEQLIKSAVIDSSNQYFFSSVPAISAGQSYYVRFSNPDPGSGVLRLFDSNSFSFGGGSYRVPNADITDVSLGAPGASNTAYNLPLTLNWFARSGEDRYSVRVFRQGDGGQAFSSNSAGQTFNSNIAAQVVNYTIPSGSLGSDSYFALVYLSNPLGSGVSNRLFTFRVVGGIIAQPTVTSGGVAIPARPVATNTRPPVVAAARATNTSRPRSIPTLASTSTARIAAQDGSTDVTATASPAPATLPPGPQQTPDLPKSGGELPVAGLVLAGFTLLLRRFRLLKENN